MRVPAWPGLLQHHGVREILGGRGLRVPVKQVGNRCTGTGEMSPKKQNVPVETGTQLSTKASVSHYYVLSSKIFENLKLFCYSSVFSDIGMACEQA